MPPCLFWIRKATLQSTMQRVRRFLVECAAEEGKIDTAKSLFERGVDVNTRNASNETPLDRAAAKGSVDVVRLLVEQGAR